MRIVVGGFLIDLGGDDVLLDFVLAPGKRAFHHEGQEALEPFRGSKASTGKDPADGSVDFGPVDGPGIDCDAFFFRQLAHLSHRI